MPAKVKDVYLAHLLEELQDLSVRSAIIFCSTCAGCHLLAAILAELGLSCVALHSHKSQKRRLAALHTFKAGEHLPKAHLHYGSNTETQYPVTC